MSTPAKVGTVIVLGFFVIKNPEGSADLVWKGLVLIWNFFGGLATVATIIAEKIASVT